ncbi:MAG: hypothetical protein KJ834_09095, partial [Alphaproteobacteria bacterium]|nr:hypothetical protein [Alphaproteobacteria bacterium]
ISGMRPVAQMPNPFKLSGIGRIETILAGAFGPACVLDLDRLRQKIALIVQRHLVNDATSEPCLGVFER